MAGFSVRAQRKSAATASKRRATTKGVTAKTISEYIVQNFVAGPFTLSSVAESAGGSPMTVRKAVEDLVTSGVVRRLGPIANHAGPGRSPIEFEVSKKPRVQVKV